MVSHRQKRVGELIQEELAELLQREVQDPRLQQVSITGVDVSPDLQNARIYFSLIGSEADIAEVRKAFEHASGFLRRELAARVKLRFMPALTYHFDNSLNEGDHIERLLRQIAAERVDSEVSD